MNEDDLTLTKVHSKTAKLLKSAIIGGILSHTIETWSVPTGDRTLQLAVVSSSGANRSSNERCISNWNHNV